MISVAEDKHLQILQFLPQGLVHVGSVLLGSISPRMRWLRIDFGLLNATEGALGKLQISFGQIEVDGNASSRSLVILIMMDAIH